MGAQQHSMGHSHSSPLQSSDKNALQEKRKPVMTFVSVFSVLVSFAFILSTTYAAPVAQQAAPAQQTIPPANQAHQHSAAQAYQPPAAAQPYQHPAAAQPYQPPAVPAHTHALSPYGGYPQHFGGYGTGHGGFGRGFYGGYGGYGGWGHGYGYGRGRYNDDLVLLSLLGNNGGGLGFGGSNNNGGLNDLLPYLLLSNNNGFGGRHGGLFGRNGRFNNNNDLLSLLLL